MKKKKTSLYQLTIISVLGILIAIYYLSQNIVPAIQTKNEQIREKRIVFANEKARLERLKSLAEQQNILYDYAQIAGRALPHEDEKTSIPLHLDTLAKQSNVVISRVIGGIAKGRISEADWVNIEVRIRGSYTDCLKYIQALANSNRITSIDSLAIEGKENDTVEINLQLRAYFKDFGKGV